MLSIGDFARLAGLSVRMLRHYDQLGGLLTPQRVDEFTGYRYYSAAQLDRANRLLALKELGFSLEQLKSLLDGDVEVIRELLRQRRNELAEQLAADAARLRLVEARLHTIERKNAMSTMEFTTKPLHALSLAQVSTRVSDVAVIESEIGPMFDRVNTAIEQGGVRRLGPGIAHYTVDGDDMIVAAAEQVATDSVPAGLESAVLPAAPKALTTFYRGAEISGIHLAWQDLVTEVESRGLIPNGTCREVYHETPYDGSREPGKASHWVVEIQQPIA